ncbi:MAG: SDR family NAD(P)-dependent oxidoreductase [Candidatus Tectimicrobiota bacterium]
MKTGLAGKVVLITGATRNHGRAGAMAFAEEGAHLLLCTRRSMDLLEETAQLVAPFGVKVVTGQCDVTDEQQVQAFVQKGLDAFGRIDVVINNAGWRARGDLLSISTDNWLATLGVNLHAPFLMSKAVLPSMVQHRWGRIINYSGIAAFRGSSGTTAKMAAEGLTRCIAREYGQYNITANLIGPGSIAVVRTPGQEVPGGEGRDVETIPIPRQGTVDECTATVLFLASEQASYITGQTYLVNGGAYFL